MWNNEDEERHTEVDLRRMDPVPFVPATTAKSQEHPPAMSRLPISKADRSVALVRNSLNLQWTFVNIVRRCVEIQSQDLLLTILVRPSDQSDLIRTHTQRKIEADLCIFERD